MWALGCSWFAWNCLSASELAPYYYSDGKIHALNSHNGTKWYKTCIWSKNLDFLVLSGVGKLSACSIKTLIKVSQPKNPWPAWSDTAWSAETCKIVFHRWVQDRIQQNPSAAARSLQGYTAALAVPSSGLLQQGCHWPPRQLVSSLAVPIAKTRQFITPACSAQLQFSSLEKTKTIWGEGEACVWGVPLCHFWRIAMKTALK